MPLISFQKRFVPAVENGLAQMWGVPMLHEGVRPKRQTIRSIWRNGVNPHAIGCDEHLWAGSPRQGAGSRKLGTVRCTQAVPIRIDQSDDDAQIRLLASGELRREIGLAGPRWDHVIATRDGFANVSEMLTWFENTHGPVFEGVLIRW